MSGAPPIPDPRAVIALLANEDARMVLARVILADPLPEDHPRRYREALLRLQETGLIIDGDAGLAVNVEGLRAALATTSTPRPRGIERFVREGRIVTFPSSPEDRREVLRWVADAVLQPGEVVDEPTLNERLATVTSDHVLLRRYLVDGGIVDRHRDGSAYTLAP